MRGVAGGALAVADYLEAKTDRKREADVAKTDEQRRADEMARIVGMVYMSIGQAVSIVVDNNTVSSLALTLNELFPLQRVTVEEIEPGKSRLLISPSETTSDSEGGSVH